MAAGEIDKSRFLAILLGLTGLGTLIFWVVFAAEDPRGSFLAQTCPAWYPWECSFIVADGWVIAASLVGAWGLFRRRPWGLHWAGMAGSGMLFLALMDILFFLQNGLYLHRHPEVLTEALIHLWLLGLGIALVGFTSLRVGKEQRA
ncbi:MAG: hypothetical protein H5T61_00725 [Thermoflexales bacterium]|nr:hypothetical protein [Thermoflexales bacterium]